ncbi:sensor histidine kinase RegB [Oceaniglobus indicus]|uniref:sensor histidine kinase RegB n=1 Tax=Oceaniglobus indicus TaxID=2047749 RepID=UPI001F4E5A23|nr:ActS/PrrB/RegB family redox-sensitive histidine kinase [Oceaniglobus indicus]
MDHATPSALTKPRRSNWVRLRTLVFLRSIAVVGQMVAILLGAYAFGLKLELGWCFLAVGAAVLSNLVPRFIFPENKRLSAQEMQILLLFDISQLTWLLFLTGGLNNPFALLILAPVTISATTLERGPNIVIAVVAMVAMTLVGVVHLPLVTHAGYEMQLPRLFIFGFWVALMIGIVFLSAYARRVTSEVNAMGDALAATQMALAREQKLTDLGGVVAATAHELGTPLATIKLVASELLDELENSDLRADAVLIGQQADRCRDILRSMGRVGKDDLQVRTAPISSIVEEAAEPHRDRGRTVLFDVAARPGANARQPEIERRPEIIHGLRNLVQNAVDFARETVWIDVRWSDTQIFVRIADDGPGYPASVLPRLGDPFLRRRGGETPANPRPHYEGMGLGMFIAKTLLERSGAELSFANGSDTVAGGQHRPERRGAIVETVWNRADIDTTGPDARPALGSNRLF